MKKKILLMLMFILMPLTVYASGTVSVSKTSLSIKPGNTATFDIKASNAAGKVSISSSNTNVATVSSSQEFVDNNSITITVTAKSEGTAKITVKTIDVSDYDENEISKSYTINVKVAKTTTAATTKKATVTTAKAVTETTTTVITTTSVPLVLKNVKVGDFDVTYKDGIYYATVKPSTSEVEVSATADPSLTLIGLGTRTLAKGEDNKVEVIIRNQNGDTATATIIITRPVGDEVYDTKLTNLSVINYKLDFNPNTYSYTVTVPYNTKEVYILATAQSSDVNIVGDGVITLKNGKAKTTIRTSYEDLTGSEYTITIKQNYDLLIMYIIIGLLIAGLIGITIYMFVSRKKLIKKKDAEKDEAVVNVKTTLEKENKDIVVNGEENKVGERIVKPTLVENAPIKVNTVRPVVVHKVVKPQIVKTINTSSNDEKSVIDNDTTTTIHFD